MKILGLDPILSLGIGILVAGLVDTIGAIVNFIKDPTWENFVKILEGISIALVGIGVIIGVLTGNWIPLVIGLIALIVTEVVKNWDEISKILGQVGQWIYDNVIMPVWNFIQKAIDWIVACFNSTVSVIKGIFTYLLRNTFSTFSNIMETSAKRI